MKENLLWVDKYKPLIINDIIGNKLIVKKIVKKMHKKVDNKTSWYYYIRVS